MKNRSKEEKKIMVLSKEDRLDVIGKFQKADKDTGSPSVQVALITERIKYLSDHLKTNKKDFSTERGLVKLVGQRKRLLAYLKKHNFDEYNKITRVLKIRK